MKDNTIDKRYENQLRWYKTPLEKAVARHMFGLPLEEVQKIFNQNLNYNDVASEDAYASGMTDKYFSENNYGDLDKDKEWLIEQLIEGAINDYDGCATLGELASQLVTLN